MKFGVLAAALLLLANPAAGPAQSLGLAPGPGASQSLDPAQAEVREPAVLESGHVDIGPRYRDGRWTVQIHDDARVPPVWRSPDDAVLRVRDTARQAVPEDETYAFLGEKAGTEVYVVPQTQQPDVVWIGWNTQDPAVMKAISRGVTMTLRGVQGPGRVTVYLQSGNLGAPQVLWNSANPAAQPIWAETNTHTHANWVFGKPGAYLVAVRVSASLADGGTVSADAVLRFAVGDATDPASARSAVYAGALAGPSAAPVAEEDSGETSLPVVLVVAVVAVVAVLLLLLVSRGASARRRAEKERA